MINIVCCAAGLVFLGGCVRPLSRPPLAQADLDPILLAVADSMLSKGPERVLYVVDMPTSKALSAAVQRQGRIISTTAGQVWCDDPGRTGRTVGTLVALAVDSVAGPRAVVRWSSTCLRSAVGSMAPSSFGEAGTYEVLRQEGRWRVSRTLTTFSY